MLSFRLNSVFLLLLLLFISAESRGGLRRGGKGKVKSKVGGGKNEFSLIMPSIADNRVSLSCSRQFLVVFQSRCMITNFVQVDVLILWVLTVFNLSRKELNH